MNTSPNSFHPPVKELVLPAILGAVIPFALLSFIILTKENVFESWMFFPLLIIPSGGAFGGILFFLMGFLWFPTGNQKLMAIIFSTLIYLVTLWLSSVMAFALTGHWN